MGDPVGDYRDAVSKQRAGLDVVPIIVRADRDASGRAVRSDRGDMNEGHQARTARSRRPDVIAHNSQMASGGTAIQSAAASR